MLTEGYADQIARDWNAREDGAGFVLRFEIDEEFASRYPVRRAGTCAHLELWVPADELDALNDHIIGKIEVLRKYRR